MVQTRSLSLRLRVGSTLPVTSQSPDPPPAGKTARAPILYTTRDTDRIIALQTVLHFTAIRQKHQPDTEAEADDSDSSDRAAGGGALLSALSFVR